MMWKKIKGGRIENWEKERKENRKCKKKTRQRKGEK